MLAYRVVQFKWSNLFVIRFPYRLLKIDWFLAYGFRASGGSLLAPGFYTVGGRKARRHKIGKMRIVGAGFIPSRRKICDATSQDGLWFGQQPGTSGALFPFLQKDPIKGYNRAEIKVYLARRLNHKRDQTLCLNQMNRQLPCRVLKNRNF